jgi:hypothetical protein
MGKKDKSGVAPGSLGGARLEASPVNNDLGVI